MERVGPEVFLSPTAGSYGVLAGGLGQLSGRVAEGSSWGYLPPGLLLFVGGVLFDGFCGRTSLLFGGCGSLLGWLDWGWLV